ncbi:MAG: heme A synthase [Gemmatimonadetes bacterium]|nr:heme A synthase [Gemmatimonadota bacterium]
MNGTTVATRRAAHHLTLAATAGVTLALLILGSVVHATESSLACPDWPTCFGSLMPAMTGGVVYEHTHRLVAGAVLVLMAGATVLTWRNEVARPSVRRWALVGFAGLIVQAVLGGVTVLLRLPDAVSIAHLGLALAFLVLVVGLTIVTSPSWPIRDLPAEAAESVRVGGIVTAALMYLQSLLGAAVRHADAGLACPDVPTCYSQWIPPLEHPLVVLHFTHRAFAVVVALAALAYAIHLWQAPSARFRLIAAGLATGVLAQIAVGLQSVVTGLAVAWVSAHTGIAAVLVSLPAAAAVYALVPAAGATPSGAPGHGVAPQRVAAAGP